MVDLSAVTFSLRGLYDAPAMTAAMSLLTAHEKVADRYDARFLLLVPISLLIVAVPMIVDPPTFQPMRSVDIDEAPVLEPTMETSTVNAASGPGVPEDPQMEELRQAVNDNAAKLDRVTSDVQRIANYLGVLAGAVVTISETLVGFSSLTLPIRIILWLGIFALAMWIVDKLVRYGLLAFSSLVSWRTGHRIVNRRDVQKLDGERTLYAPWYSA